MSITVVEYYQKAKAKANRRCTQHTVTRARCDRSQRDAEWHRLKKNSLIGGGAMYLAGQHGHASPSKGVRVGDRVPEYRPCLFDSPPLVCGSTASCKCTHPFSLVLEDHPRVLCANITPFDPVSLLLLMNFVIL